MKVNDAIFKLMDTKLITSVTIMANGTSVEDAIERLKKIFRLLFWNSFKSD